MYRIGLILIAFGASLVAQTGQLNVSVKDEAGAAVTGALVTVSARAMFGSVSAKPGQLAFHFTGRSGANGVLPVPNVPPGAYALCGQMPGSLLVDSCSWNDNAVTAVVKASVTAVPTLVLKKGAMVVVQLNDGQKLLASEVFPGQKLRMEVGTASGHRVPMIGSQQGAATRQFSAVVPVDTDLKLQVRSQTFQVTDSNGNKLDMKDPKAFIPLRVTAPAALQTLGATAAPHVQLGLAGVL
jgi:hypothetical protein